MRKKIKTMDDFAVMVHKDYMALDKKVTKVEFASIRRDMATKVELNGLKFAVKELQGDVKHINENMISKVDLSNIIRDEYGVSEPAKQIEKLRTRMERVENKLGIL